MRRDPGKGNYSLTLGCPRSQTTRQPQKAILHSPRVSISKNKRCENQWHTVWGGFVQFFPFLLASVQRKILLTTVLSVHHLRSPATRGFTCHKHFRRCTPRRENNPPHGYPGRGKQNGRGAWGRGYPKQLNMLKCQKAYWVLCRA